MTVSTSDPVEAEPRAAIAAERRPILLLAGPTSLARQLSTQLPNDWHVIRVDADSDALEAGEGFTSFRGEPTSALVLRRAGADDARALLAALPDRDANLEICRLARDQLKVPRVAVILRDDADAGAFHELGAEVIAETALAATAARNLLEGASVAVEAAGLGQGELVQITLQPSSPVAGRRFRVFRQNGWTLAAIFRGDRLILPDPDTVLRSGDRLLLAGQPDRLSAIAEYLRVGRARFPLPYGTTIAGLVWGTPSAGLLCEVAHLAAGVGRAEVGLTICGRDEGWQALATGLDLPAAIGWSSAESGPEAAISALLEHHSLGCLVVPDRPARLPRPFSGVSRPLRRALDEASVPILVPRGSFPYERVLLPAAHNPLPQGAVQVAFDLSEHLGAELVTLHVQAPAALEETSGDASTIDAALAEVATIRRRHVRHERRVGNPIAEIERLAQPNQIVVLSHRRGRRWRSLRPDVSAYLAQRLTNTVMLLPVDS